MHMCVHVYRHSRAHLKFQHLGGQHRRIKAILNYIANLRLDNLIAHKHQFSAADGMEACPIPKPSQYFFSSVRQQPLCYSQTPSPTAARTRSCHKSLPVKVQPGRRYGSHSVKHFKCFQEKEKMAFLPGGQQACPQWAEGSKVTRRRELRRNKYSDTHGVETNTCLCSGDGCSSLEIL